jgi:glycosyltransferase involved in cell wall biosynthesis
MTGKCYFSIIVPVKEVNDYIRETIPYIQALNSDDWELIVVPNEDGPNEWASDQRIKFLRSGRVGPAEKRDLASKIATGSILVFLDDDSYPASNLLSVARNMFEDQSIDAIGGPALTPPSDTYWQKVSGSVFMSRLTGGNPERYLPVGVQRNVDDWPSVNFMIRNKVFQTVGGFDSPYWPGEDTHLCLKVVRAGSRIVYAPNLIVWHHRRSGLGRHMKQVGAYGLHRGYFARHLPETSFRLKYFIPSAAFIVLAALVLIPVMPQMVDRCLIISASVYGVGVMAGCVDIAKKTSLIVALGSLPFVVGTHITYGFYFLKGFLRRQPLVSRLR